MPSARKKIGTIDGLPEMPIQALRLTDVTGTGAAGLTVRYTDGLKLREVDLHVDRGQAISVENSSHVDLGSAVK
jgi:hypothetical protein